MSNDFIYFPINLQLFAEGGDGGTGSEGASGVSAGVPSLQGKGEKNSLANVQYGIQENNAQVADVRSNNDGVDRNAEFERLIKTEYKDLYDARVQDTIQKRLKSSKETVDRYNALAPTLETLSRKYGVDANDIAALNKAIEEDDSYYEEEALQKGISVEQLKSIRKMEKENAELKAQMNKQYQQERVNQIYANWLQQSDAIKGIYPSFDLNAELQNPNFAKLVQNDVDVRTAYEIIHKDEIIPAAMQFTARQVEQKLTNKIMAGGSRPVENGISGQASVITKSDVSQLSKEDRQEIIRRVARGEKIRF